MALAVATSSSAYFSSEFKDVLDRAWPWGGAKASAFKARATMAVAKTFILLSCQSELWREDVDFDFDFDGTRIRSFEEVTIEVAL